MAGEPDKSEVTHESLMEKISQKIHGHDSSSSSSDNDSDHEKPASPSSAKEKVYRLFGREKPVHKVLGGGKPADVFLWRDKKTTASILGGATIIWVLFELAEYHLLTLVCHVLIFLLAIMFLYSNAFTFIKKSPPHIPDVHLPEQPFLQAASVLRAELNQSLALLHSIASGRDFKKFLIIISVLWVMSVVGSWCNFLTLFYIVFVLLHIIPFAYEKYDHKVDPFAEKAMNEMKKQYRVFNVKVLSKIPKGPFKGKTA